MLMSSIDAWLLHLVLHSWTLLHRVLGLSHWSFEGLYAIKWFVVCLWEYTSCICGDEVLPYRSPFAPQTHLVSYLGTMGHQDSCVTMVTMSAYTVFQEYKDLSGLGIRRGLGPFRAWG